MQIPAPRAARRVRSPASRRETIMVAAIGARPATVTNAAILPPSAALAPCH
jgi:hypothetical protein